MLANLPTIGVRFDINKIDSGSYGVECWKIFWRNISPSQISGALLFDRRRRRCCRRRAITCTPQNSDSHKTANKRIRREPLEAKMPVVCCRPL